MRAHPFGLGFSVLLCWLFVVSFCNADGQAVDVVGAADCADCLQNNFRTSQAFSGLHVTIECKRKTGEIERAGETELDDGGEFKISLLKEIIHDGESLKKDCYAQLHNAAAAPCAAHDGFLDMNKIVVKSQTHDKITLTPAKTLRFSTALCTSKFLWPFYKYPPLPKTDPWKKKWPKINVPHLKNFGHPWVLKPKPKLLPPLIPIYKPKPKLLPQPPVVKPLPPIYKPKPKLPIVKPLPPIYKPKPKLPIVKPLPPIYKPKPKPPIVKPLPPIYKPKPKPPIVKPLPPVYKPKPKLPVIKPLPPIYKPKPKLPVIKPLPPSVPIYKPPVVTKPLPPIFPLPPLHKKPCPPFTKIPPKFKHHKLGHYFPKPPFNPYP